MNSALNVGPFHVQPQSGLHDCEYEFDLQKSTIMVLLIVGTSPSIVIEDQVIYTQQFTSFNLENETVCNGEPRDEKIRAGDISNFSASITYWSNYLQFYLELDDIDYDESSKK